MGRKKNSAGKNFTFVNFKNVGDIWKMENEMQGIICGGKVLSVNVSKYGRNRALVSVPKPGVSIGLKPKFSHLDLNPSKHPVHRGTRSFVEVAGGTKAPTPALPLLSDRSTIDITNKND
ncbi:hypothetical protein LXL04_008805 [Taraxacum kok-saghyz]